jgi:hypothetical protein
MLCKNHKYVLQCVTVMDIECDANRPLSKSELSARDVNLPFLEDTIDAEYGLVEALYSANCITRRQREYIKESRPSEKNCLLLDILARRSFADFKIFIDCLHKSGQSHVARVLEEGGGKTYSIVIALYCITTVSIHVHIVFASIAMQ